MASTKKWQSIEAKVIKEIDIRKKLHKELTLIRTAKNNMTFRLEQVNRSINSAYEMTDRVEMESRLIIKSKLSRDILFLEYEAFLKVLPSMKKEISNIEKKEKLQLIKLNHVSERVKYLQMQYEQTKREMEKGEEAKANKQLVRRGVKLEPILDKIKKLPEALVDTIRGYLPYSVRIVLLETKKHSTLQLLGRLKPVAINHYLTRICRTKEFLTVFDRLGAIRQIRRMRGKTNPYYHPLCSAYGSNDAVNIVQTKIQHVIDLAKEKNPAFAYKILSAVHVLFNPTKKYRLVVGPNSWNPRNLVEDDLPPEYRSVPRTDTVPVEPV
jgi:hypothetical protein